MTEDPASLARDANRFHQTLKELLNTNDPYGKEVEFPRKNLRKQYLQLLLVHPHAPESKDAETHLWMQTSYAFITAYKRKIQELEQQGSPQQQQSSHGPGSQKHVEHHKLVQRFRQFLAEEEKFWAKLVSRLYRTFALEEARPNLEVIGIVLEDEQSAQQGAANVGHGRNQQLFPTEESTPRVESKTAAEKEARMSTLGKVLVCLGDVARYRELYNEAGGRPKAGHEDGGPARKRNRKGPAWIDNMSKARNYDKAQQCYDQAKLLVPNEGKSSHQLAILASYKNDAYLSLAHYYRALCVKQPCDTALNNMRLLLIKNLKESGMEATQDKGRIAPLDVEKHPGHRVDQFKKRVVCLHALWRLGSESGIEKMNSIARKLDNAIFRDFAALVGQRQMPPDMITQAIVMSQGALWKLRMLRDSSGEQQQDGSSAMLEWSIVKHIMDMHSALLEVGRDEVKVPPSHDTKDDLGQQLSAVFKRTLPALRVASKWLRANVKYLSQDPEFAAYQRKRRGSVSPRSPNKISGYSHHTKGFWELYAEFLRTLARTFPFLKLPKLASPLEEDADLRGFLPLKRMMSEVPTDEQGKVKPREEVHPNEEQLMRIADLIQDARALAGTENAPIQYYKSGIIMLNVDAFEPEMTRVKAEAIRLPETIQPPVSRPPAGSLAQVAQIDSEKNNEDNLSDISPDDDEDVVRAAFNKAFNELNDGTEDDDEQIVFDPRPTISPPRTAVSPPATTSPVSPSRPIAAVISKPTQSSNRTNGTSRPVAPTTAEDLLKGVMGFNRSPTSFSVAPQPPISFNSNTTHRSTQSIWSTLPDEQKMMAGTGLSTSPLFHSPPLQYSSLAATTQTPEIPSLSQQSIWGPPPPRSSGGFEAVQQTFHSSSPGSGLGFGVPSPFSQHLGSVGLSNTNGANAGHNNLLQHKRISSFTQQIQLQQQSQYQNHPSVSPSSVNPSHRSGLTADPPLALATDGIRNPDLAGMRGSHDLFYNPNFQAGSSHHTRHLSYNDPRLGPGMQHPPPSVWGNT